MADKTPTTGCSRAASEKSDEFPLFSSLPVELQCRIFKEAFPDPEMIYWDFYFQSVIGGEADPDIFLKDTAIEDYFLSCSHARAHMQRYLRKIVDTLSMSFMSFISVNIVGGKMTLNKVTNLALKVDFEYNSDELYMRVLAKFYISLSIHCPALNTLQFFFGGESPATGYAPKYQTVDISEGCVDLDWDFPRLKQSLIEELGDSPDWGQHPNLRSILEELKGIDTESKQLLQNFHRFINTREKDTWDKPGEETLKYWQNIRPTPVLLMSCLDHSQACTCCCTSEYPELYFRMHGIYLRVRKDGTPLHKYTGLRQIFDGEPW